MRANVDLGLHSLIEVSIEAASPWQRAEPQRMCPERAMMSFVDLHPAHKPDNQGDDKNSSKDAAEIHRNLLLTSEHPIETDMLSAVGALPHTDLSNQASK